MLIAGLVLLGCVAFTLVHAAVMRRRWPLAGRIVTVQGTPLRAEVRGRGPAVVLVHGMYANGANFPEALLDRLAERHTVVVFDRPGHGASGRLRAHRAGLAENVAAVRGLWHTLGLDPAIVLGHSYGATIALRWALEAPDEVRGVIALAPLAMPGGARERVRSELARPEPLYRALAWTIAVPLGMPVQWLLRHQAWSPMRAPRMGNASRALATQPEALVAGAAEAAAMHDDLLELAPRYGSLRVPLVVVAGRGDLVTPTRRHAERLAAAVPGATLRVVEGVGHQIQFVAVDAIVAEVERVTEAGARAGA